MAPSASSAGMATADPESCRNAFVAALSRFRLRRSAGAKGRDVCSGGWIAAGVAGTPIPATAYSAYRVLQRSLQARNAIA